MMINEDDPYPAFTDWVTTEERINRMQADIDSLKCERAELIEALRDIIKYVDAQIDAATSGDDPDWSTDYLTCASHLLSRYGR